MYEIPVRVNAIPIMYHNIMYEMHVGYYVWDAFVMSILSSQWLQIINYHQYYIHTKQNVETRLQSIIRCNIC